MTLRLASVAPAVGAVPVWMTNEVPACWCGERLVKTAWIVDRRYGGALEVKGESLEGDAAVSFPRDRENAEPRFHVPEADQSTAPPGGVTSSELEQYAFHVGYVSYPRPGCYRFTASVGRDSAQFVVDQARCTDCEVEAAQAKHAEN